MQSSPQLISPITLASSALNSQTTWPNIYTARSLFKREMTNRIVINGEQF